jgi:hypothetical protein
MTEDEELEPEEKPQDDQPTVADPVRRALKKPGGDTEKALGLEMARLFGLPLRLLVQPPSRPAGPSSQQDEEEPEGGSEAVEGDDVGD